MKITVDLPLIAISDLRKAADFLREHGDASLADTLDSFREDLSDAFNKSISEQIALLGTSRDRANPAKKEA